MITNKKKIAIAPIYIAKNKKPKKSKPMKTNKNVKFKNIVIRYNTEYTGLLQNKVIKLEKITRIINV